MSGKEVKEYVEFLRSQNPNVNLVITTIDNIKYSIKLDNIFFGIGRVHLGLLGSIKYKNIKSLGNE